MCVSGEGEGRIDNEQLNNVQCTFIPNFQFQKCAIDNIKHEIWCSNSSVPYCAFNRCVLYCAQVTSRRFVSQRQSESQYLGSGSLTGQKSMSSHLKNGCWH